jgi:hypothetical protein
MSDTATTTDTTDTTSTDDAATTTDTVDAGALQAEVEKWKNLARKHEDRAKANAGALKELEEFKRQQMSDAERIVDEARASARAEALAEVGGELVKASLTAALAGRLTDEQIAVLVEGVNAASFLTDDGKVDADKVTTWVDGIAPKPDETDDTEPTRFRTVDLGQGARGGSNLALNGDPLEQALKRKLGIR